MDEHRRRRAIVHIGAPRTGSTSVQKLLDRYRDRLNDRGLLYPSLVPASADRPHLNHQHLGETFDGRRPRAERTELLAALERGLARTDADMVVLSYERFCLIPRWRGVPGSLAKVFRRHGFHLEILYTVRPQAGAVQSQYAWRCQFLREGRRFGETFDRDLGDRRLDPAAGLAPWLAAAEGRCTVVPLADARSAAPLAHRLFAALGLADRVEGLLTPGDLALVENGSLDAAAVEVSRRLRQAGVRLSDNAAARRVVDFIEDEVRRHGLDRPRFQGLDAAMVARAETRFARVNDRFAARAWGEPWAARVAPDRPGPVTEIAAGTTPQAPATEAALAAIVEAARERFGLRTDGWRSGAIGRLRRALPF